MHRRVSIGRDVQSTEAPAESERPGLEPAPSLLDLQRRAGNRATLELLRVGQARLEVGAADDPHEREAEAVARQVVAAIYEAPGQADTGPDMDNQNPGSKMARKPLALSVSRIARRATSEVGLDGGPVSAETESAIEGARSGGGRPIEPALRGKFEDALGADLSAVRLHTGSESAELNRRVQAEAFTTGNDIFLGAKTPDLGSRGGQELLAHELTHTIQQTGGSSRAAQRVGDKGEEKNPEEMA